MKRTNPPTRREEARLPEAGSPLMRRFAPLSLALHLTVFALFLMPSSRPQRPVYAQPVYQVALVASSQPNYQPPIPKRADKPRPAPVIPPKQEAKKVVKKTPAPKETVPAKQTKPSPVNAGKPAAQTVDAAPVGNPSTTGTTEDQPVSLGRVDQPGFREDWYLVRLQSILAQAWEPPVGGTGVLNASVHFRIRRDGTIEAPEVTGSSGWSLYDRSALGAVLNTRKLPPLPDAYVGDHLGLTVDFQRVGESP